MDSGISVLVEKADVPRSYRQTLPSFMIELTPMAMDVSGKDCILINDMVDTVREYNIYIYILGQPDKSGSNAVKEIGSEEDICVYDTWAIFRKVPARIGAVTNRADCDN